MGFLARPAALVLLLGIVLLLCPPSASAEVTADEPVCVAALRLVDDARPQAARTMLDAADTADPGACDAVARYSDAAIASAQNLADRATGEQNVAAAAELAATALAIDADNADARAAAASAADAQLSDAQLIASGWARALDVHILALRGPVVALVAVVLALLASARLLTLTALPLPRLHRPEHRAVGVFGLLLIGSSASGAVLALADPTGSALWGPASWCFAGAAVVAGAVGVCLVALLAASERQPDLPRPWSVLVMASTVACTVTGLVVVNLGLSSIMLTGPTVIAPLWSLMACAATGAAAGVLLFATWIGTRLRVSVDVHNADGSVRNSSTGQLLAYLNELGAEKPRGVEAPRGTEMDALTNALDGIPEGRVAQVVLRVVRTVLGTTPWRVIVDEDGDGRVSAEILRNGRSLDTMSTSRQPFRFLTEATERPVPEPDLKKFVAAFVVTTMSLHHQGFEGLLGARSWSGVGLYYIATTDLAREDRAAQVALAHATAREPANWLAQFALRRLVAKRADDDPRRMRAYGEWIGEHLKGEGKLVGRGTEIVRLRSLWTRLVLSANADTIEDQRRHDGRKTADTSASRTKRYLADLEHEMNRKDLPSWVRTAPLFADMESAEKPIRWSVLGVEPEDGALSPFSPTGHFNRACYYAMQPTPEDDVVADALQVALSLPRLRDSLARDPQLARFRNTETFRRDFSDPIKTSFADLDRVQPHREKLERAGLRTPAALARSSVTEVAQMLRVARSVSQDLVEIARIADSAHRTVGDVGMEVVQQLDVLGHRSVGDVLALTSDRRAELARQVARSVSGRPGAESAGNVRAVAVVLIDWFDALEDEPLPVAGASITNHAISPRAPSAR